MGNTNSIVDEIDNAYDSTLPLRRPDLQLLKQHQSWKLREEAEWTRDSSKTNRKIQRWAKKKWFNSKALGFALSKFDFDHRSGDNWECTEILGQGSFGVVGLWQRGDERGYLVDSVAVKQVDDDQHCHQAVCYEYKIPMEALCMYELRHCPNITQLRDIVFFQGPEAKCRFYLEYCENGTISELIEGYQEYNRRHEYDKQYIPEAYLWFVFHGMAKVLFEMEQPNFNQLIERRPNAFLLHFDAKADNVLLSTPLEHDYLAKYPIAKVADWGLARLTSKDDPSNSSLYYRNGTQVWHPPEQRDGNRYCQRWRTDIFGHLDRPYSIAHTLWQFAAIVYSMATLSEHNKILDDQMTWLETHESLALGTGCKLMERWPTLENHYSKSLLDLLADCLRLHPGRRLSPLRVKYDIENAMRKIAGMAIGDGALPPVFTGPGAVEELQRYARMKRQFDYYEGRGGR